MAERLQKILAQWGIASRRQAEQLIQEGRVLVNGTTAHLGQKADPEADQIEVDGSPIHPTARPHLMYLLLNKPLGVVTTNRDPWNRRTVLNLLPTELQQGKGIHSVGRLDADSTGALLLTNDGELTCLLTHPRYHIPKTYRVLVQGHPPESVLQAWRDGIILSGQKTLPAGVQLINKLPTQTWLEVVLREGRNRQIRRVAEQLGYPVIQLHRTAIGSIQLNSPDGASLAAGYYRTLTESEISFLKSQIGLTSVSVPADIEE